MSKTLCHLPWMHLLVDGRGQFFNCCYGIGSENPSKDEDGKTIIAGEPESIARHWHSLLMKDIRQSMLDGKKHPSCYGCWRVEDTGSKSFREIANKDYPVSPELLKTIVPPVKFRYVDLRFGNLCNLACRMCDPYSSAKLSKEFIEMYGQEYLDQYKNMNWFKSPLFWEELYRYKDDFEKIHLVGGEPLLVKECWKFLRTLSEDPCAKNIVLSYNTNLSHIPPEALEIWPKFKGVVLLVSMDGIGRVNEFIRYPLKWSDFEKNLWEIENNFEKYNILNCQVQPTIQAYNILRVREICDFLAGFENIKRVPIINLLFDPEHFSPGILPPSYRYEAVLKIKEYINEIQNGLNALSDYDRSNLVEALRGIINYINLEYKPQLVEKFHRYNEVFDKHRSQKILEYIPELEVLYP